MSFAAAYERQIKPVVPDLNGAVSRGWSAAKEPLPPPTEGGEKVRPAQPGDGERGVQEE